MQNILKGPHIGDAVCSLGRGCSWFQ